MSDALRGNEFPSLENDSPALYYDSHFGMHAAKISPGELYASHRNILIVTVLGSCVSTCLMDPVARIGGMNHFMLPDRTGSQSVVSEPARYGAHAMEMLINNLLTMGANRGRLIAKVFGAGRVLPGMSDVGARNAEFALDYLSREGITVSAKDVGGNHARKVYFFVETGRVLVKEMRQLHNDTLIDRERAYAVEIRKKAVSSRVELFED
jgi:chemotaxis protein CheD